MIIVIRVSNLLGLRRMIINKEGNQHGTTVNQLVNP